ncbi:MAG: hypothetical protein J0I48_17130 [Devosia sp.]|uniref:hypothetical protein n=1 Tax=Devosia sp. 66-22 TaxID=1895753 RepID=UPI00092B7D2F|nr:hypothetical protein [Devosia sp. 66-22]MBN9347893.1 hypothetical protein [Devosia sp.]OJX50046.1 MAG: hypothetical protein BGO81_05160 [Devosia sp. 66-22]
MTTISREKLHEKVWSQPLTKVAAGFGVTGTALKKTCARHDIPTPERGYWAKLQHGKPAKTYPLPANSDPALDNVHISGGSQRAASASVLDAQARARDALALQDVELTAGGDRPVPEPKILDATRRAGTKAKADHRGFISVHGRGLVPLNIAPGSLERSLSVLSRLLALATAQGHEARATEAGLVLVVDHETIPFAIEEQTDRSPHVATSEDIKRQQDRARWGLPPPKYPQYDHHPAGRLALQINANEYGGLRRKFADGRTQSIEKMLVQVLEAMAGHAVLIREQREERAAQAERYRLAEERRRLQQAFASREKERIAFVDAVHAQLIERRKLQAVLGHFEGRQGRGAEPLRPMIVWVQRRIAQIDAMIEPHALDLSARAAKIDFDEPEAGKTSEYYYSSFRELDLWSDYDETGTARSLTPFEWATAAGLLRGEQGEEPS